MIREIVTAIRFEADMRKVAECAKRVDRVRRRLIVHQSNMLKSFAKCEATAAPEVIEDEENNEG